MKPLDAALAYAKRGWPVFPCVKGTKQPATKNGLLDAVTDPEQIARWWADGSGRRAEWSQRNVAVVTSAASGFWVLDCDTDHETGELLGEATLADLVARHGALPPHPIATTPRGGRHHFFAWPDDGGDLPRRIKFAPGLDALGSRMEDGQPKSGYLLVYPSVTQDGAYAWEVFPKDIGPILPQAPPWLVAMIRADAQPETRPAPTPTRSEGTSRYGRSALEAEAAKVASCPPGSQDDTLIRSATRIGSLAAGGEIDHAEAVSTMVAAGMRMTNGDAGRPWTLREIEAKVRRGMEYGARDPYKKRPLDKGRPEPSKQAPTDRPKPQLIVSNPEKPEPAAPAKATHADWMMGKPWVLNDEGKLKPKEPINCQLMIEHHPELKGMFSYNEFTDRIMVNRSLPGYEGRLLPRQLGDHDEAAMVAWLNWHGLSPNVSTVGMFIREIAFRASFDPLRNWLASLKWDRKPRIDKWLTYYAAAEDTPYNRMVGRKFLVSAAARALSPGCKVDTMLVLEGQQSIGKSTLAFRLFGAEFFSDQVGDVTSKDSAERIQGCWCVEVAEMDKFTRVEANAVKSFLSHREDRYRPAYGRNTVVRPRRCVFLGTINPDGRGYLKDKTGNRRFWPVAVQHVDMDAIDADREQLWAEAVDAFNNREPWWLSREEEEIAAPEQDARRDDDVWEPKVRQWLEDRDPAMMVVRFTSADCLAGLGIDAPRQGLSEKYRVATILKALGCEVRNNQDGIKGRFWVYKRGQST